MQKEAHEAEVFRDGRPIAVAALVITRFQPRAVPVPQAGMQSVGYKDVSTQGPTTIRVAQPDPVFAKELIRLQAGARDVEIGRRDRQWRPEPIDLAIGGQSFQGCELGRPSQPYGSLEETEFDLHHSGF